MKFTSRFSVDALSALALATLLSAPAALAHPTDSMALTKIGVGTTIRFTRNLQVASGDAGFYFNSGDKINFRSCRIAFPIANHDRVLKAGSTLTVSKATRGYDYYGRGFQLQFTNQTVSLLCDSGNGTDYKPEVTIGDLRRLFYGTATITLAAPKAF